MLKERVYEGGEVASSLTLHGRLNGNSTVFCFDYKGWVNNTLDLISTESHLNIKVEALCVVVNNCYIYQLNLSPF